MKKGTVKTLGALVWICIALVFVQCKSKKNADSAAQESKNNMEEKAVADAVPTVTIKEGLDYKSLSSDPYKVDSAWVMVNTLYLQVQYGGGCEEHTFELFSNAFYLKSLPMKLKLFLKHHANNDACRSVVSKELSFDIAALQSPDAQHLQLLLNKLDQPIDYKY